MGTFAFHPGHSEREARKAVVADMTKLRTDVVKIFQEAKEKPDAKAAKARALVEEFVKTRGLKSGESGLRTEWTIEEDPGLAPLKDAWAKAVPAHGRMRVPFGGTFFWERDRPGSRRPATGVYRPEFYPDAQPRPELAMFRDPEPVFLTWRTEEKAARPVPFNEARPEVIAAWKRLRAREIAKTRAETIAAQIQKRGTTSEYTIRQDLNDQAGVLRGQTAEPKAQEKIRRFALPDVAPLAPPDRNDLTGAADREALRPFGLTASPDIPYPTREMVRALLDERTKPLNTALVLPDAPHDTYYVAVVAQRLEKNDADFSRSVYSETGVSGARAAVRMAYAEDARRKTTESVLALLRQEFKYAETDDQKKKIDKGDREGD